MNNQPEAPLDNPAIPPIVMVSEQNKETPPGGDTNTDRGLTSQADGNSMEATQNPISALSSRQLLSPAVDDFSVKRVEYCPPPESVLVAFTHALCSQLNDSLPDDFSCIEVRQGFRQFLNVLIRIQTKQANKRGAM